MTDGSSQEARHSDARRSEVHPTPLDLAIFLPYASAQLQAPYAIRVLTHMQEEYVSKVEEKSKKHKPRGSIMPAPSRMRAVSPERALGADDSTFASPHSFGVSADIVAVAVLDAGLKLVELDFRGCPGFPRLLMQILALCVPFHPLLGKLSLRRCRLDAAVLHELGKLLPLSHLSEVCLDDSAAPHRDYHLLLRHGRLARLSLARCRLGDDACAELASALAFPRPAAEHLRALTLASNSLSDAAAVSLAAALRCNRTLQHLDLSGNGISDAGAQALLRTLVEFPLTYDELMDKRRRHVAHLLQRREAYRRCHAELTAGGAEEGGGARGPATKRRTVTPRARRTSLTSAASVGATSVGAGPGGATDAVSVRAEAMAAALVGANPDPFGPDETVSRDGYAHSLGNTALCYLNLAYNSLGYPSLVALCDVLQAQAAAWAGTGRRHAGAGPGLLRAVLDGNPMPVNCEEFAMVSELLDQAVSHKSSKSLKKMEKPRMRANKP